MHCTLFLYLLDGKKLVAYLVGEMRMRRKNIQTDYCMNRFPKATPNFYLICRYWIPCQKGLVPEKQQDPSPGGHHKPVIIHYQKEHGLLTLLTDLQCIIVCIVLNSWAATYNFDAMEDLINEQPKCSTCGQVATKRCSRCQNVWYCKRYSSASKGGPVSLIDFVSISPLYMCISIQFQAELSL